MKRTVVLILKKHGRLHLISDPWSENWTRNLYTQNLKGQNLNENYHQRERHGEDAADCPSCRAGEAHRGLPRGTSDAAPEIFYIMIETLSLRPSKKTNHPGALDDLRTANAQPSRLACEGGGKPTVQVAIPATLSCDERRGAGHRLSLNKILFTNA